MAKPYDNIEKALTAEDLPEGSVTVEVEQTTIGPEEEEVSVVLDDEGGATISIGEDEEEVSNH